MSKSAPAARCGLVITLLAMPAGAALANTHPGTCVDSPQKMLTVCVATDARGPFYEVYRGDRAVIAHARLGVVLDGFGNAPADRISDGRRATTDQTWEQPWGEQRLIREDRKSVV